MPETSLVLTRNQVREKKKKRDQEKRMSGEGMKAFQYVMFSGKKEDFPMFAAKLKALLAMKGCSVFRSIESEFLGYVAKG